MNILAAWPSTSRRLAAAAMTAVVSLVIAGCQSTAYPPAPRTAPLEDYQYIIGPLDTVNVIVWRNPELSLIVPVRPDGKIATPLIDDLTAQGKTPSMLARDIEKALGKFIRDPVVTVIVTTFVGPTSEQIRVIGEAAKPQILAYRKNMTLLDVMIAVGGLTDFADGNSASIFRVGDGGKLYSVRLRDLITTWRHLCKRRHAPRRHTDHSAELLLVRNAASRLPKSLRPADAQPPPDHPPPPPRDVEPPLDRSGRGMDSCDCRLRSRGTHPGPV